MNAGKGKCEVMLRGSGNQDDPTGPIGAQKLVQTKSMMEMSLRKTNIWFDLVILKRKSTIFNNELLLIQLQICDF